MSVVENDKSMARWIVRKMVSVFAFMALGAVFYAAQTETLNNCRAVFSEAELIYQR